MNNGLFKALGGVPQNQQMNPMQMVQQLRANPLQFLSKAGYKVPQNLNDPNAITRPTAELTDEEKAVKWLPGSWASSILPQARSG